MIDQLCLIVGRTQDTIILSKEHQYGIGKDIPIPTHEEGEMQSPYCLVLIQSK